METKIIGIILLICAALLFQYSYDDFMNSFFSPGAKLKVQIEKDISTSIKNSTSQPQSNIHHVKFNYRSENAFEFLKNNPPNFQTSKDGKTWLEVEVLDLQDEESPGFITQISVFDVKTKNKIGEFGNTYYLKNFGKLPINSLNSTPLSIENKDASVDTEKKENKTELKK